MVDGDLADSHALDSHTADAGLVVQPRRSARFPITWKPGFAAKSGHALEDYSFAGYRDGGVTMVVAASAQVVHLPAPATDAFDSRADIQTALDKLTGAAWCSWVRRPFGSTAGCC